jgi:hypothetical protein
MPIQIKVLPHSDKQDKRIDRVAIYDSNVKHDGLH